MTKYILRLWLVFNLFQGSFCASLLEFSLIQRGKAEFECPNSELGFYPADDLCSANYYTCYEGNAFLQECPPGSVFDPYRPEGPSCIAPEYAYCNGYVDEVCPAANGTFPIHETCGSDYIECVGGAHYNKTCENGNVFDPVTLTCTLSDQASCNQNYNCPADGIYPYPDACTSIYYVCSAGQATLQYCPVNQVFDPAGMKCEKVEDASCTPGLYTTTTTSTTETTKPSTETTKTTQTTQTTTETTTSTASSGSTPPLGNFTCPTTTLNPNNNNYPYAVCSPYYYTCSNGDPYILVCPGDLIFNPQLGVCDYPSNISECQTVSQLRNKNGKLSEQKDLTI